jgi:hypothetical protein
MDGWIDGRKVGERKDGRVEELDEPKNGCADGRTER